MNDVPLNEVGEIVYQGRGVMNRFWNNEAAPAEAIAGGEAISCAELGNVIA